MPGHPVGAVVEPRRPDLAVLHFAHDADGNVQLLVIVELRVVDHEVVHAVDGQMLLIRTGNGSPVLEAQVVPVAHPQANLPQIPSENDVIADLTIAGHIYRNLAVREQIFKGSRVTLLNVPGQVFKHFGHV